MRWPAGSVHLAAGAAYDANARPLILPDLPAPAAFPYPEPDADTVVIVARVVYRSTVHP